MKILDRLHLETKNASGKQMDVNKLSKLSVEDIWAHHIACHASVTSKVFEGLQKVDRVCQVCQNLQRKHEVFSILSFSLGDNETQFEKIMSRNFQPELLKDDCMVECEACKKKTVSVKRTRIVHVPDVMIMTLKRFEFDAKLMDMRKIDREISYKDTGFGLPLEVSEARAHLELFAVIVSSK